MKNGKHGWWVALAAVLLLGTAACEQEPAKIRLTSSERIRIDTLVKQAVDSLVPVMDSLCDARYPQMVQEATDSIIQLRREEERTLRERLKQQIPEQ